MISILFISIEFDSHLFLKRAQYLTIRDLFLKQTIIKIFF